jgi:two-component system response regulator RegX3
MARVLVVECRSAHRVATTLRSEGVEVDVVATASDAMRRVQASHPETPPDLVVIEAASVDHDVRRLCRSISLSSPVAIAVLAGSNREGDVIAGYADGAHAILVEPVGTHEFVARIRALLRRVRIIPEDSTGDVLTVGPVVLDRARRCVTVAGRTVPMPRREFEIAEALMARAGTVVSRVELLTALWGASSDTKSLDVQVGRLRARLVAAEGRQRIMTVRGVGYRFVTDDDLERIAASTAPSRGRV